MCSSDLSGFTALPGGFYFNSSIGFMKLGEYAKFWTSSQVNGSATSAYNLYLKTTDIPAHNETGNEKILGASVRCLQGQGAVGINQNMHNQGFDVYPNPADETISVNCNSGSGKVFIYNILGAVVLQQNVENASNRIDISHLSAGMYLITFESGNTTYQKKLVIE